MQCYGIAPTFQEITKQVVATSDLCFKVQERKDKSGWDGLSLGQSSSPPPKAGPGDQGCVQDLKPLLLLLLGSGHENSSPGMYQACVTATAMEPAPG